MAAADEVDCADCSPRPPRGIHHEKNAAARLTGENHALRVDERQAARIRKHGVHVIESVPHAGLERAPFAAVGLAVRPFGGAAAAPHRRE